MESPRLLPGDIRAREGNRDSPAERAVDRLLRDARSDYDLKLHDLGDLMDDWQDENGRFTEEELAEAEAEWPA